MKDAAGEGQRGREREDGDGWKEREGEACQSAIYRCPILGPTEANIVLNSREK